jgi:RNA polymerase sigma-70 factor (ECF subfamily)
MWTLLSADEQASLAQRIRDGNADAEEAFVRLFGERIRVMMLARIRDPETARELTQDALLAAWRSVREGRLRDVERLAPFVLGTARNIVNNYIRARAAEPRLEPLTGDADRVPAPNEGPDRERRELVAAALRRLSADDREVLLLTLVRGLTPREIARELGLGVDVVRTRKSRALKRAMEAVADLSRNPSKGH